MSLESPTLTERAAKALGRRFGRRNFLTRSALLGSALAVAPVDYTLKPKSAYAAICSCNGSACNCGSLCCDGYTEFCCTLNGQNRCPAGTVPAGWWKVDGSGFCGGGPRYYFDCNAGCGGCGCGGSGLCGGACSGTGCGCANGSCANRKSGCTLFRYGQCNQQIACLGPIVCRVITCIPPWQMEPTCTTTTAVDNVTRYHDAPCLHRPVGSLDIAQSQGGGVRVAGWALDPDTTGPIYVRITRNGGHVADVLANQYRGDVAASYPGMGPYHGFDTLVNVDGGEICAYALNTLHGSEDVHLGCRNVPAHSPFGSLDIGEQVGPGQFRVAGWAIDPDTTSPIQVHVYLNDDGAALVANGYRPDVGAANPGYGSNHGFDYTFTGKSGVFQLTVYAINVGAGTTSVLFSGPVKVGGNPIGAVDVIDAGPETLAIAGWSLDPDTADPIEVHAYVDNSGAGLVADANRPDIGFYFPAYGPNHGFSHTFTGIPGGTRQLSVWGINVQTGQNAVLFAGPVAIPGGNPQGHVDIAHQTGPGEFTVEGWALDPDVVDPVHVHVHVTGGGADLFADVLADQPRNDIAAVFPDYGPNHGFAHTITGIPPGSHTLSVFAINVGTGATTPLLSLPLTLGGSPVGSVDVVETGPGRVRVAGWAIDTETVDPIHVHAYLDGSGIDLTADLPRPDLAPHYPGFGENHGFDHTFETLGGDHHLAVFAINVGSGDTTVLFEGHLPTPGGSPFGSVDIKQSLAPGEFTVAGWAIDPDTIDPVQVHAYLDGTGAALVADQPRPDLLPHHPNYGGDHGFDHTFTGVAPGTYWLSVFIIDVGQGSTIGIASEQVTVT